MNRLGEESAAKCGERQLEGIIRPAIGAFADVIALNADGLLGCSTFRPRSRNGTGCDKAI